MFPCLGCINGSLTVYIVWNGNRNNINVFHLKHFKVIFKRVWNPVFYGKILYFFKRSHRYDLGILDKMLESIGVKVTDKSRTDQANFDSFTHDILLVKLF